MQLLLIRQPIQPNHGRLIPDLQTAHSRNFFGGKRKKKKHYYHHLKICFQGKQKKLKQIFIKSISQTRLFQINFHSYHPKYFILSQTSHRKVKIINEHKTCHKSLKKSITSP